MLIVLPHDDAAVITERDEKLVISLREVNADEGSRSVVVRNEHLALLDRSHVKDTLSTFLAGRVSERLQHLAHVVDAAQSLACGLTHSELLACVV